MHMEGFRGALTSVINEYARKNGIIKEKEGNLTGDDIREGLTAVVSVKLADPQFEGQTKAKLGSSFMRTLTRKIVSEGLADYLEEHPKQAREIIKKAQQASKSDSRIFLKFWNTRQISLRVANFSAGSGSSPTCWNSERKMFPICDMIRQNCRNSICRKKIWRRSLRRWSKAN